MSKFKKGDMVRVVDLKSMPDNLGIDVGDIVKIIAMSPEGDTFFVAKGADKLFMVGKDEIEYKCVEEHVRSLTHSKLTDTTIYDILDNSGIPEKYLK